MIVIDTSVWVSHLIVEDVHHVATNVWLDRIESTDRRFAVPAHFMAEVSGVLSRVGTSVEIVREVGAQIELSDRFEIIAITVELGLRGADIARQGKIRGSDAIFLALAATFDLPLITWDHQQRERGALFCRTMTPTEAIAIEPD